MSNGLPVAFLARIIWQESRFDPNARSRAGAQGIAQFMPRTAAWRGLVDPFDPLKAIPEAAGYLRELRASFGNVGLAAAAYNAGPGRLSRWLAGRSSLPSETSNYVLAVTRRDVSEWVNGSPQWESPAAAEVPCNLFDSVATASAQQAPTTRQAAWTDWGVQLVGNWTQTAVLASFERLRRRHSDILGDRDPLIVVAYGPSGMSKRFLLRVTETTREGAERLCSRLKSSGVSCFAARNPTEEEALAKARRYAQLVSALRRAVR